jgi:hypothetical protein
MRTEHASRYVAARSTPAALKRRDARAPAAEETRTFTFDYSYWSHDEFEEEDDGAQRACLLRAGCCVLAAACCVLRAGCWPQRLLQPATAAEPLPPVCPRGAQGCWCRLARSTEISAEYLMI